MEATTQRAQRLWQTNEGETMSGEARSDESPGRGRVLVAVLAVLVLLLLAGVAYLGLRVFDRLDAIEQRVAGLNVEATAAADASKLALERADQARAEARDAAEGRLLAEADSARARAPAADAEARAMSERERADAAAAEAERIRKEAQAEMSRLEEALGNIAETRRTALGLVMNLGEDALKFDFDKAEIRPENRELLSRIAGVLMTSSDFTLSVNGHTDDVGSDAYNQKLSERRAQAVYDYLAAAGISPAIMTVQGWGKTRPLVEGTSPEARAKNRRVELGIVNARVHYKGLDEKDD
jgi:outer membrane protein OmpA-like peptidoglycan-associated protein